MIKAAAKGFVDVVALLIAHGTFIDRRTQVSSMSS